MESDPDAMIRAARAGEAEALGRLMASYGPYLELLARVQVGKRFQGKVDPADFVQDTFVEAQRQFPHFRGTTEPELTAWLRTLLAGQLALMFRRYLGTQGRDIRLERELDGQLTQSSQALDRGFAAAMTTPSGRAARREQAVLLAAALAALPADYREVIVLRHMEQMSFADVAARMGRSEDSVQKVWVRALARLRQGLGGDTP